MHLGRCCSFKPFLTFPHRTLPPWKAYLCLLECFDPTLLENVYYLPKGDFRELKHWFCFSFAYWFQPDSEMLHGMKLCCPDFHYCQLHKGQFDWRGGDYWRAWDGDTLLTNTLCMADGCISPVELLKKPLALALVLRIWTSKLAWGVGFSIFF